MEYTINKLAKISGVSTRTLRYYDQIGLLCPKRIASNGYRIYGQNEVDLLQQILFYRELGVSLEEIDHILKAPDYDKEAALVSHLSALLHKKQQLELLINTVTKTISTMKGERNMSDQEKFEGFKQTMLEKNEAAYGEEIREKYGDDAIDASNAKVNGMRQEQLEKAECLRKQINDTLKEAFVIGDPSGELAQQACDLHRQWICMFWKDRAYSKAAHMALAEMYIADERFTAYYDTIAVGCAKFLRDAMEVYCRQ